MVHPIEKCQVGPARKERFEIVLREEVIGCHLKNSAVFALTGCIEFDLNDGIYCDTAALRESKRAAGRYANFEIT